MEIVVSCDGESVTAESLIACIAVEDRHLISLGPKPCGQSARTGWIWSVAFRADDLSRAIWATSRFMSSVRQSHRAASANLSLERRLYGEISCPLSQFYDLLGRIDYLEAGIRDAIDGLKKTRSLIWEQGVRQDKARTGRSQRLKVGRVVAI